MRVHAVLRLSTKVQDSEALQSIGETMNSIWPGIYKGLRKSSPTPAFDGDIAQGESWEFVMEEVRRFATAARSVTERLREAGVEGTIDLGVWLPASQRTQLYPLTIQAHLHEDMGHLGWSTEISLYVESAAEDDESEDD